MQTKRPATAAITFSSIAPCRGHTKKRQPAIHDAEGTGTDADPCFRFSDRPAARPARLRASCQGERGGVKVAPAPKLCWPTNFLPGVDRRKRHLRVAPISVTTLAGSFAASGPPKPTTNRTHQPRPNHPAQAHRTFPLPKMVTHASTTGWLSSVMGQALLYDAAADGFRNKETVLDWFAALTQVASREGSTWCSPEGMHDDRADNNALAARRLSIQFLLPPCPAARPARLRASFQGERRGNGSSGSGKGAAREDDRPRQPHRLVASARDKALLYDPAAVGFRSKDTVLDRFTA